MTTDDLMLGKNADTHKTPKTRAICVAIYVWAALATGLIHSSYQLKMCGDHSVVSSLAHAAMWPMAPVVYSMALVGSDNQEEIAANKCKTFTVQEWLNHFPK